MIYQGNAIKVLQQADGYAELQFDLSGESINKFNVATLDELAAALDALRKTTGIKGLVLTSAKSVFIVGADITEFNGVFSRGNEAIAAYLSRANGIFSELESLPFPTVVAINGYALGGGWEVCLACDFRVMSDAARIGLPETKLGIIPGFGGTVRLPRLLGVDHAIEWIASGAEQKPAHALEVGAVDAVVAGDVLRDAAFELCAQAAAGVFDYAARRKEKTSALALSDLELMMAFTTGKAVVLAQAGKNFPAPMAAVSAMEKAARLSSADAVKIETDAFLSVALTPQAQALIGIFLNDQALAKTAKSWEKKASKKVEHAAVLGAGIMGGGIAYQSAYKGVPVVMKDIAQHGLDLGLAEANKLLTKQVEKGRMKPAVMGDTLNRIVPTLSYEQVKSVDMVVEAVVENIKVKQSVLSEVEKVLADDAIVASNTSTISISQLAESLQRPQNFCGMHFFNPVHAMPLVEVIRGEKTSDDAVARTVAYANAMGKKAIVVNDCPGFLVNRVLFPYFAGFVQLVKDGADFQQIDRVMEKWGWPMGPAFLCDVVGIDTCVHAAHVLADGFPDRMKSNFKTALEIMYDNKRLGQKNGVGFYNHEKDKKGKPVKVAKDEVYALLAPEVAARKEFSDEEIIARMMVPMCTEMARCLDEKIVESAVEADMALIYGLGFPVFRGGVCRWMDAIGMQAFVAMTEQYAALGKLYEPTASQRAMAANQQKYFA
ncbi:MAG: fatty acid oxidation complex subunit alpha FadB [Cellvibrionales bacterium]|nr:fatty acid oxidation complex subunit alpha FadB [Cellvibrionales bacterium]